MKALRIIGAKTEEEVLAILGGNKTKAFFLNIYRPDTSLDCTIDTWMLKMFGIKNITPKRYKEASAHLTEVALEMNLKPHQVQALVWVGMRGKAF
jgi:thermostable 8-oxoguanine DNA glycosylase